ncbi:MAG TPA: hydantoinase/oxoprolinase family protein [Roseiflexaceae bacterium]|nr:hydantoinase/oxoprolinase family protein [Roseiflexaceae bacterium]
MTDILGIDIGGTFTDFVLLRNGHITTHKLLSTPADPADALLAGVADLGAPAQIVHGTTVATNALLERRGAATALITTHGFGDLLAIGRGERPELYNLDTARPPALVPAAWRLELAERLDFTGSVVQPIDPAGLAALVEQVLALPIESVAICLLHSYANPAHEQAVTAAIAAHGSHRDLFISASHRIVAEPREYERTSTTVVNAYVAPALDRYIGRLSTALTAAGVHSLRIMGSDGGSMGPATARELPARATLSGPAGGIVGARSIARRAGFERIITFDMGGTSTDVALCDGSLPRSPESRVGGLPVRLPSLDIHTVGAGGGSLARIDAGGALRVGPESAGADPGPACYGRGSRPTVTDANLILGRLQAGAFLGGRMQLAEDRARAAFAPLAEALGGDPTDPAALRRAASGVVRVANAAMERAIRTISVERGEDPRDCVLVAFGGAGPLHAAYLAEALGIRRVLIPRYPGVLSALGMLTAEVSRDTVRTLMLPLEQITPAALEEQISSLAGELLDALHTDGEAIAACRIEAALDMRYPGQSHELTTPLAEWPAGTPIRLDQHAIATAASHFHTLHEQRYGHAQPDRSLEAVLLRVRASAGRAELPETPTSAIAGDTPPVMRIVVAALAGNSDTPTDVGLYQRDTLPVGYSIGGPAIVVQLDATTIIPFGWQAHVDRDLNLLLVMTATDADA